MNARPWILGAGASLASGLLGYAIGVHQPPPVPVALPPVAPKPLPPFDAGPLLDAGLLIDAGPPGLPTKVALTEPKLDDGVLDPHRPLPVSHDDGGRLNAAALAAQEAARRARETPEPEAKAPPSETLQQLDAMAQQLKELQAQLAATQQEAQERQAEADQRAANHHAAMAAMQHAEGALAQGSTDIESDLAQAEGTLDGPAAAEIQSARSSLQNGDLYSARQHLQRALVMGAQGNPNAMPAAPQ